MLEAGFNELMRNYKPILALSRSILMSGCLERGLVQYPYRIRIANTGGH
jgi:hypothetical protein